MRKLSALLASAALLIPASAFAQTPTYSPGQTGAVGTVVTANDPNGKPRQVVMPSFNCASGCSGGSGGGGVGTPVTSTNVPIVTTGSVYTTGFVVGGIQSFISQPAAGGVVMNAEVNFSLSSGTFSGSWDLVLFDTSPTGGGTSDNAAYNLTSTDYGKVIGVLHLTDCTPQNAAGTIVQCQVPQPFTQQFNLPTGTTVYGVAVVRGTPTLSAAPTFRLLTLH